MPNSNLLQELIVELLVAISGLSTYPVPDRPPEVVLISHQELEGMACDRPCEVYGWFPGGRTIFLDDRLNPVEETPAAGILVHELVHFLQQENGRFSNRRSCEDWVKREQEAYQIQIRWLRRQSAAGEPSIGIGPPPWRLIGCDDGTAGDKE
ncbi:hypothetical protein [Rhodospirillaceae bacterium SYSU D60014]|uniref:hypothetical protein n=1 Tax=Virgifigura deserti TaxID=2268457 RepID=UPI000E6605DE